MSYPLFLTLHLFAALVFIGTVFFGAISREHSQTTAGLGQGAAGTGNQSACLAVDTLGAAGAVRHGWCHCLAVVGIGRCCQRCSHCSVCCWG